MLALSIVLARLVPAPWVVGGAALALAAIAGVALVSRLFPSTLRPGAGSGDPAVAGDARLSFPLGYWNGLGIEVALAYPLLLAIMISRRSRVASAVAAFPLPIIAAVMYLASSRGAFVAAGVAVLVFSCSRRGGGPARRRCSSPESAGAVAVAALVHKKALVNGEMGTALGVHQGHRAALLIGVACVVTALVWPGLAELGAVCRRRLEPSESAVAVAVAVLAIAAIVASHPVRKFDEFKSPVAAAASHGNFTTNHLVSSSGSGRWQFWSAAVSEFRAHPLNGGGAGSWQAWWLQHGSLPVPSQFAHSLYLEALAELGILGFLLIAGAVLVAVVGAVRSALALQSGEVAAAAACGIAFFAAAAYDWVWQLAGIALVGVGMLGFALGALPAERAVAWGHDRRVRPILALLAVAAIIPQFVVLAAGSHLSNSQDAFTAGDGARARSEALAAKAIEPWAASPYLQLGLIAEARGALRPTPRAGRTRRSGARGATGACGPAPPSSRPRPGTFRPRNATSPRRAASIRTRSSRLSGA